jgi:hypothetical protein
MTTKTRTSLYIGIIILVILLAGISFYQKSVNEPYVASNEVGNSPNEDTDRDGLKNWEEVLWKTNPNVADTDSDGTGDGEEIAFGRDPLVSGPNDYLDGILFDGTETQNIAINLIGSYVETLNTDSPGPINTQKIVDKALENEITRPFVITYDSTDLHYTGNSTEDYRVYGNNFASLFSYFENSPDEMSIVLRAMQSNDENDLVDIDIVVGNYQSFLSNLLVMNVPKDLGDAHLSVVNSLSTLIADINGMKLLFVDPVIASKSILRYQNNARIVQISLIQIIEEIRSSGVEYSTDEIGYALVNIL